MDQWLLLSTNHSKGLAYAFAVDKAKMAREVVSIHHDGRRTHWTERDRLAGLTNCFHTHNAVSRAGQCSAKPSALSFPIYSQIVETAI